MTTDQLAHFRHELRTPVNHIIGYSEMLRDEAEDLALSDFLPDLQQIRDGGGQLLGVIENLLNPSPVAAEADLLDFSALEAQLRRMLDDPLNQIVSCSRRLQEKAMSLGKASLTGDLRKIELAARQMLALAQAGVTESKSAQLEDSVRAETPAEARSSPESPTKRSQQPKAGFLLVVDDNPTNRDMLSRRLEREGYTVAEAEDGRRALEMIAANKFDLVLLDIMMPEMNGYDVLRHLKADEKLRDIPVIMISALDEIGSVVRCIEMGAEDFLSKPFDPVLLRARIGACLEKKRLRDQEVEYLQQVNRVTAAAAAVESETFNPQSLDEVAQRPDALGQLARVFQRMAREVYAREQRLKAEVQQLRIEIDEVRKAREVAEITDSGYFKNLRTKAKEARNRREDNSA
jgi:DNA-binding response OmpR family regulator